MNNHTTQETITTGASGSITLEYADHFAKEQFIKHILRKYEPAAKANQLLFLFSIRALQLTVDYGQEHNNVSKNQLAYYLFDVIPEVTFSEIVAYCDNEILSDNARQEKYDYWDTKGAEL